MTAIRSQLRANLVAGLQTIVGLRPEDGVSVVPIAAPADVFFVPGDKVLGVCRTGGELAPDHDGALFAPGSQMRKVNFALVMKVDCPLDSASTLTMDGGAEDLMESACKAIQRVNVGTATTGPVYVEAQAEDVLAHPDRVAGEGGGPIALVHHFKTTEFEL